MTLSTSQIVTEIAGLLPDGRPVHRHVLSNAVGVEVSVLEYGSGLEALRIPDRHGRLANVLAGGATLEERMADPQRRGALLGRYAGCIAQAQYESEHGTVQLAANCGPHHCDGGEEGLHAVLWSARHEPTTVGMSVVLSHVSPAGAQGYPGAMGVQARYVLSEDNLLYVDMLATSTEDTICNLAQHCCFNLADVHGPDTLAEHELEAVPSFMLPEVDGLPVAQPMLVHGTEADFRMPVRVGERMGAHGVDCFLVLQGCIGCPELVARLQHHPSGRGVELYSTRPGLRVRAQRDAAGLTLADMHLPDSPNWPRFPSVCLPPGGSYHHTTVIKIL